MAAALEAEIGALLELEPAISAEPADAGTEPSDTREQGQDAPDDGGFAFRLFAAQDDPVKVVLPPAKAAGIADGEIAGGIVRARPRGFYLAKPTAEDAARYEASAVSGEELLARAGARCWGLEVPWRVKRIVAKKDQLKLLIEKGRGVGVVVSRTPDSGESETSEEGDEKPKRKRPGKKRRIVLRTREKVKKEKAVEAQKKKVEKEEHLREKKARLNRERKLKRRQKARDEKASAKAGGADAGAEDPEGDDAMSVDEEPMAD